MFTADMARDLRNCDLDARIQKEVTDAVNSGRTFAYLRIYSEDWFFNSIEQELLKRGFQGIFVPNITLKGDVYFSW